MQGTQTFRLLVDALGQGESTKAQRRSQPDAPLGVEPLEVPFDRPSSLGFTAEGPSLCGVAGSAARLLLEPVRVRGKLRLLLAQSSDRPRMVRINGALAPSLAVLNPADQVTFEHEPWMLHVTVFHQPFVGAAPVELVGSRCVLCSKAIAAGERVLVCCACGKAVLHAPDAGTSTALDCANRCTRCPACDSELVKVPSYSYLPEAYAQ